MTLPRPLLPLSVLAGLLALLGVFLGGCSLPSLLITPVSNSPVLEETVVQQGRTKREKIALIEVEGMLTNSRAGSGGLLGAEENKVSLFRQQLDAAAADDRVKAVLLRINSPGGTVSASDAMYEMVIDFKRRTGKPVVAACQDLAASGGYYVACAADEIHATRTSIVGSIGVLFQTLDVSPLLAKVGVSIQPISSGPMKDMGSPFDGLSEAERQLLQEMVDEMYQQFREVVEANRSVSDPETAFDGRVFTARGALELGLIDRLATLEESIERTRQLAGAKGATAVMYKRPYGYRGSIYASAGDGTLAQGDQGRPITIHLPAMERLTSLLQPGAYYLWMP